RFPVWRNEPWKSQGVRSMPVKNYLVFYHVNELLHRVTILRVFYNRRNA
ncbi:MAG: type II toxin-antitoxin system RelE/ParE family toxin, partial [Kiritimatiellae bacterium]|nr:type II toxin-antitoxin system RelE/ParE family toxin [Kiritimatiellia bacterium]